MNFKVKKTIFKLILFYPICFGLVLLLLDGNLEKNILFSFVITGFFLFYQLFDYDRFSKIEEKDFLESSHLVLIKNDKLNWKATQMLLKEKFKNEKIIIVKEEYLKIKTGKFPGRRVLMCKKTTDNIELSIKYQFISIFPDRGKNYSILRKLVKEINRIENFANIE